MDLIINNASLDEITVLCSRIGIPSLSEICNEEKQNQIDGYMEQGFSYQESLAKYEDGISERVEKIQQETEEKLHLDGPPQERDFRNEINKLAANLASNGKRAELIGALKELKIRSIPEIPEERLEEAFNKFKEI